MNVLNPSPPHHRTIFAVDIEGSTTRNNSAKADLRGAMYELVEQSFSANGITPDYRDPFVDRGDGILALVRPVDEVPKTLLLANVVPTLTGLLAQHEEQHPGQHLRLRAVLHAGEVHQDIQGCFGEALDVAFRLLDAPEVKGAFRLSTAPLVLVVSDLIYRTIVLQGYQGIDEQGYTRAVDVLVGRLRYRGWMCLPDLPVVGATTVPSRSGPRIVHSAQRFEQRRHVV